MYKPDKVEQHWRQYLECEELDFSQVYKKKIERVIDKKIAEFNFKMLHKILPCNSNLNK